ncbi:MAG TPA: hypothetical protein ENH82_09900 [bacterium]|nr:hypothetical protein [bacterium]
MNDPNGQDSWEDTEDMEVSREDMENNNPRFRNCSNEDCKNRFESDIPQDEKCYCEDCGIFYKFDALEKALIRERKLKEEANNDWTEYLDASYKDTKFFQERAKTAETRIKELESVLRGARHWHACYLNISGRPDPDGKCICGIDRVLKLDLKR